MTNIWAGIGAKIWAVSEKQAKNKSIVTKAKKFSIGAFGVFYCVEQQSLTTPFLVSSKPREEKLITDIWPEKWALSFGITPLCSPYKKYTKMT